MMGARGGGEHCWQSDLGPVVDARSPRRWSADVTLNRCKRPRRKSETGGGGHDTLSVLVGAVPEPNQQGSGVVGTFNAAEIFHLFPTPKRSGGTTRS